jgi:hypothetical protein
LSDFAWETFPFISVFLLLAALAILLVFAKLQGPDYKDWMPVIGSVAGGLFTATAAIVAVHVAHRRTMYREQLAADSRLDAVLQAILVEMKLSLTEYSRSVGKVIEAVPDGDGLQTAFTFWEKPFPIYESNCGMIGSIPGSELREAIVTSYFAAYALLSSIRYNSELVNRRIGPHNAVEQGNAALRIKSDFPDIRRLHLELMDRAPHAIKLLERELAQ